jgi:N-methylhydantoinase A
MWIGIDAGGTFTDVVGFDPSTGALHVLKQPSTPAAPAQAILDGIRNLLAATNKRGDAVQRVHHGTTIATNALLQKRLARTGMVTTAGFRDVLDIARQRRPHLFDLGVPKPDPIAPRALRIEIAERVDERGNVIRALEDNDVRVAIASLRESACEAVAICFLHAYANPAHERRVKEHIEREWPEAMVCTSNDVLSEMREYERFATTVVNAGLLPIMSQYLTDLSTGVRTLGIRCSPRIMQSNGGTVSTASAAERPVKTFVSGPAAGVIGSEQLSARLEAPNLITLDMGGTSTDVCVVSGGAAAMQNERSVAGLPLRVRALGIHTVGAGGGSVGWVDDGGLLKVGPMSAGADPGPAAYDRGGTSATVTDANLILGRLAPDDLLAGHLRPSLESAQRALAKLGAPLNLTVEETAAGMLRIVHVNMTGALRVVSVERGHDPRDFALMPFGGAGPLHAAELASQLGIRRIIVPPLPGLASALGLLVADARADFSLTVASELANRDTIEKLRDGFQNLLLRVDDWLSLEGHVRGQATLEYHADMRYVGQSFELSVPVEDPETLSVSMLGDGFHTAHETLNGYASTDHETEVVTLRMTARVPNADAVRLAGASEDSTPRVRSTASSRSVWFETYGRVPTQVLDRATLCAGTLLIGPAIITQMDATTLVPPDHTASVDRLGNLIMERRLP